MNNIHNLNFIIHHLTEFYEKHLLKGRKITEINIAIRIEDRGLTIVKKKKKRNLHMDYSDVYE